MTKPGSVAGDAGGSPVETRRLLSARRALFGSVGASTDEGFSTISALTPRAAWARKTAPSRNNVATSMPRASRRMARRENRRPLAHQCEASVVASRPARRQ